MYYNQFSRLRSLSPLVLSAVISLAKHGDFSSANIRSNGILAGFGLFTNYMGFDHSGRSALFFAAPVFDALWGFHTHTAITNNVYLNEALKSFVKSSAIGVSFIYEYEYNYIRYIKKEFIVGITSGTTAFFLKEVLAKPILEALLPQQYKWLSLPVLATSFSYVVKEFGILSYKKGLVETLKHPKHFFCKALSGAANEGLYFIPGAFPLASVIDKERSIYPIVNSLYSIGAPEVVSDFLDNRVLGL